MTVDWDSNNPFGLSLGYQEVSCTLPKQSPAPSPVPSVNVLSVEFENSNVMEVMLNWTIPAESNGALDKYQICVNTSEVRSSGLPPLGQCVDINVRVK